MNPIKTVLLSLLLIGSPLSFADSGDRQGQREVHSRHHATKHADKHYRNEHRHHDRHNRHDRHDRHHRRDWRHNARHSGYRGHAHDRHCRHAVASRPIRHRHHRPRYSVGHAHDAAWRQLRLDVRNSYYDNGHWVLFGFSAIHGPLRVLVDSANGFVVSYHKTRHHW